MKPEDKMKKAHKPKPKPKPNHRKAGKPMPKSGHRKMALVGLTVLALLVSGCGGDRSVTGSNDVQVNCGDQDDGGKGKKGKPPKKHDHGS